MLCFIDFETRSLSDVTEVGAFSYAYHPSTDTLVLGYAFGDEPGQVWSPSCYWGNTDISHYDEAVPKRVLDHISVGGYVVAWNAAFDRHIWNAVCHRKFNWPYLKREQVLCAQAQAEGNNLPGGLHKACEALGTPLKKDTKGAGLIRLLSTGERATWDSKTNETEARMGHFRYYCVRDVEAMREVWQRCRPLTMDEWREYHASERINDRGVAVDGEFAETAKAYANTEADEINAELRELTEDQAMGTSAHLRKARWLYEQLWPDPELQEIVERPSKEGEKPRYSCDRPTREAIAEIITQPEHASRFDPEHADRLVRFLELIEAGNSAAVKKFTAIAHRVWQGRIYGSYSFNGAGQTGRFSSRGIQVHNIIRAPVDKNNPDRAIDAIDMIIEGASPHALRATFGYPVSRLLARLIRPTFIAPPGKTLIWADWDQIEARVLPWLAESARAEEKLDLYRQGRDVYTETAAVLSYQEPEQVSAEQRQALGKVPELSLGFGGGVGALSAMARGYGVTMREEEKQQIVSDWRRNNQWAVTYWQELWEAALAAYRNPPIAYQAGRVSYLFLEQVMGGTLVCLLPDGRWLVYPQFEYGRHDYVDDDGEERSRMRASFVKGFGSGSARVELWHGTLAENNTQGTAASFLRRALVRLDKYNMVVLHTHDEIVAEIQQNEVSLAEQWLREAMAAKSNDPTADWAEGLPLTVTVNHGPYYTK